MLSFSLLASSKWYPVLFDSPLNATRATSFWLTIALALVFVVCAVALKAEKRAKFLKISLITVIVYAAAAGIVLLALTFVQDSIVAILFAPALVLVVVIAACAIALFIKRSKLTYILTGCLAGAALIALLVCSGIHFTNGNSSDMNGVSKDSVNQIALYIFAIILTGAVIAVAFIADRKNKKGFDSKTISYAAICIAMSFALSYLRIVKMPQGGSITIASLLPLMIYSFMFGPKKGIFAGMIYGLLQALQDPYILHPAQFILDYPAAFACIGLAGIFANLKKLEKLPQIQFLLGGIVAGAGRFIMHFISGVFAFGEYAGDQPAWLYSLGYQAGYVLPDIAIALAVGVLVLCAPSVVKQVRKFNAQKPTAVQNTAETEASASTDEK